MDNTSRGRAGRIWYQWAGPGCPDARKLPAAFSSQSPCYDVAVLGAGVVGCAIARLLSQYELRVVVVDRLFDVGEGTSKGNSAIVHTGFDAEPGSLESTLVVSASRQWPAVADRLKIPFKQASALLLAFTNEEAVQLPELHAKALANGVDDVAILSAHDARRLEPSVASGVAGALHIPRESIVDPFTTSIAFAEVALANGVDFIFGATVHDIRIEDGLKVIVADNDLTVSARFVINSCGLGAGRLVQRYHGAPINLNPRRGQFLIYDRQSSHLVSRILLPIPTKQTKGMLIAPTIFGNLIAGPTAEDLPPDQVHATETTPAGLSAVRESAEKMCPALANEPVIASYAGLRSNCAEGSYWIRFNDGGPGLVTLAGIRSTGLTASIAIAQYIVENMANECALPLIKRQDAIDERSEIRWPGWWRKPFELPERVVARPDFGEIVCSCENVSRGEILDALELCSGIATLDGLKRRTRVLMGRCQGFNCCVPTAEIISRHFDVPLSSVTKHGPGSEFVVEGSVRPRRKTRESTPTIQKLDARYRVVIIGAGPAGVGTAMGLARLGITNVLLVDRAARVGGIPAFYEAKRGNIPTFVLPRRGRVVCGEDFAIRLAYELSQTATALSLTTQVLNVDGESKSIMLVNSVVGKQVVFADAFVFACGAREKSSLERGWIVGRRLARQFSSMNVLQLLDEHHALPAEHPAILGSDVLAYAVAAKLHAGGAKNLILCDQHAGPKSKWFERLYFRRWCRLSWRQITGAASISGARSVEQVSDLNQRFACDGVVLCGELVPNSELVADAGLEINSLDRIPVVRRRYELSKPGLFVVGAARGGFHGADWCYRDGKRAADAIRRFLS